MTLAAYGIPVSLAYASLAGLPPQYGIYCYLVGGLFYALFGSSRQLAIGPTSAISMLVGVTVAYMADGDPARFASIAALTAMLVGGMCVVGVDAAAEFTGQLHQRDDPARLQGRRGAHDRADAVAQAVRRARAAANSSSSASRCWLASCPRRISRCSHSAWSALALLLLGEKFLPGRPVALLVVVMSIVLLSVTPLASLGFKIVGVLPQGLPAFHPPGLRVRDVDGVIPLAFACLLLSYVESVSAGRAIAQANGYEIDPRQELLGLGAANLAAGFFQAYPVAGGLSQSSVNQKAGAKTPLALVFASLTIGLCLMFLTGLLTNLPNVVLAAIVLVAVKGLIDIRELRHVWRVSRYEFLVAMVAFAAVLLLGILKGVLCAVLVSMLLLIRRAAHPHVAILGRIPGARRYSDLERHPDNEPVPGALMFRVEASLLYFNADHVRTTVWQRIRAATEPLRLVICDLSTSPLVDLAGARMLATLHAQLRAAGIRLRLVNAHAGVRDMLRAEGLEEQVGYFGRRVSVADVIDEWSGVAGADTGIGTTATRGPQTPG